MYERFDEVLQKFLNRVLLLPDFMTITNSADPPNLEGYFDGRIPVLCPNGRRTAPYDTIQCNEIGSTKEWIK